MQGEEAIIIGITEPKNSRGYFAALILAKYNGKDLKYIGSCAKGFDEASLKDLYEKFIPYFTDNTLMEGKMAIKQKVQWIKPKYVCQVKFTEWTKEKNLKLPIYQGLRIDKIPKEVRF